MEEGRFRFLDGVEEGKGVWEGGFGGVRCLGMSEDALGGVCWSVLELRVTGRFGEAVDFSEKAYWRSLPPKVDFGISSVSGVIVGSCCVFAML